MNKDNSVKTITLIDKFGCTMFKRTVSKETKSVGVIDMEGNLCTFVWKGDWNEDGDVFEEA